MVNSKSWNWEIVNGESEEFWKTPSVESFYLINRWLSKNKETFLDLGCGIGRHTILFSSSGFDTYAFDLSENAVEKTKSWADELNLKVKYKVGDMLALPYDDNMFDCILCMNVISHTDTEGMKKITKELYRVLKKDGECYFTLGSKETWGFKQEDWPLVDTNTRIRMSEDEEKGIPHFYADYNLIKELFKDFKIESIRHIEDFIERNGKTHSSWHYNVLIRKA